MTRFIPKEKLGKKAQRALDRQRRQTWSVSPITKVIESRKTYNRKRKSRDCRNDWRCGILYTLQKYERLFFFMTGIRRVKE